MTTIAVNEHTRDLLKKFGGKGETYDEILIRVIAFAKKQLFFERQKKILSEEEFVSLDAL